MANNDSAYKNAGVDTKEGERAVKLMGEHVKKTFGKGVLGGLGGFGSIFKPDLTGIKEPVLIAGTDGVGTKLKLAFMMDKHDTVGQDLVAMCVNDVLCQGASPLFFLDYIATGHVEAEKIAEIVKGIADGCVLAECALVGGETAEMPGFYAKNEYDLAGFAVGMADLNNTIDGSKIKEGDIIVGVPSTGLHSNGYSLARKIFFEQENMEAEDYVEELGESIGEALIRPTAIYTKEVKAVLEKVACHGIIHITGGGFYENVPRVIPKGLGACILYGSWDVPAIFKFMQKKGDVSEKDMFSTFNMGIGMMFVISKEDRETVFGIFERIGTKAWEIGTIEKGEGVVLNLTEQHRSKR